MTMIYCVEDDKSIREIEMYTLQSTGFETKGFEDGHSFFEELKEEKPDLILLDVMLPDEDGISILTKLKKIQIQVIFLSLLLLQKVKSMTKSKVWIQEQMIILPNHLA